MNISEQELQRVLPHDQAEQNAVLRKLVVTLREKLQVSQEELKVCQTQLCAACKAGPGLDSQKPDTKQLQAAIERAAVLQADYNSLAAHFDSLRAGYKKVLEHAEQQKCALNELRYQNANLMLESEKARAQTLQVAELQQRNAALDREKQQLEKEVNQSLIAAMDAAKYLETARAELQRTRGGSQINCDLLKVQNEALKTQNEELRAQIMQVFEIASVDSIAALKEEIEGLQAQLMQKDEAIRKVIEEAAAARNYQLAEVQLAKYAAGAQAELLRQKALAAHESELVAIKQQHAEEIEQLNKKLAESHDEVMREQYEKQIAFEKQMAAERQLDTEKSVYHKSVERAKGRYTILSEQLELLNSQRDEAEARAQSLQMQVNDLQRQLMEQKQQNRLYQANYEDIFMRAPQSATGFEQITNQAYSVTSQGQALAQAVMDSLRQRREAMQGRIDTGHADVAPQKSVDYPAQAHDNEDSGSIQIEEDEIKIENAIEDAEHVFISVNHSDIAVNETTTGEYAVQISYANSTFISEPARVLDGIIEVNFPDNINICVILNEQGKRELENAAISIKLKKLEDQKLIDIAEQKLPISGILDKKQIQQDLYFDLGSITVSAELVKD